MRDFERFFSEVLNMTLSHDRGHRKRMRRECYDK
jgi:hypothetical protein